MELESENGKGLAMHVPAKMDTLKDRDMWIIDSRATSHNTPHVTVLCEVKELLKIDSITVGTGSKVGATKVGTIKGSICDKFRNIVIKNIILKDEVLVPE